MSDDLERRVLALHESGLSRRDIAEQAETSSWTVSKIVQAAGRTFPGSDAAQAASDARADKLRDKRLQEASALLDQAQRMLESAGRTYNRPGRPLTQRTVAGTLASTLAVGQIVDKAAHLMRKL